MTALLECLMPKMLQFAITTVHYAEYSIRVYLLIYFISMVHDMNVNISHLHCKK